MRPDDPPSPWVARFAPLVEPGGAVLDLACGHGRHSRLFLGRGHPVTAVDRDTTAVAPLAATGLEIITADLEDGRPYGAEDHPLAGRSFAAVVVTNYLWRPRFDDLLGLVAPGGLFLYETFAAGQEQHGRPANPEFLLQPGELLERVALPRFRVLAYEDLTDAPGSGASPEKAGPAVKQRVCARRVT